MHLENTLSTEETAYTNFYLMENPVNDKLIVKLGSNNNYSNLEVSVYNTSGQLVLVENIIYPSEVLTLNHNLNSGLYILIINNNNHYFQTKFIVK